MAEKVSKLFTFTENTTIHGVYQLHREYRKRNKCYYIWVSIVVSSLTLCIWQSVLNVQDHVKFNVRIAISFESDLQPTYPAITIWNNNDYKRTVIGREKWMIIGSALYGGDNEGVKKVYQQMNRTCYYQRDHPDIVDQQTAELDVGKLSSESTDVILSGIQFATIDREMSFAKCLFNQIEMACENFVLTTLTDNNIAFSINLDANVARNFLGNESGLGSFNMYYKNNSARKRLLSVGKDNGFQFILNVNVEEYCAYSKIIWYGAGFQLMFHDPSTVPSTLLGTTVYLTGGLQFDIVLKPVRYIRNTENLGRCISSFPLYMFPENEFYLKVLCEIQCENEHVWKRCGCLSTFLNSAAKAFARKHDINETTLSKWCIGEKRACLLQLKELLFSATTIDNQCPQCKRPCLENGYKYQITTKAFPPNHLAQYYMNELNVTDKNKLKKDFLMLNIFFESNLVNVEEEHEKFTLRDMFIYIGNNIGLFLGMSFMTFGEILDIFLGLVVRYIQNLPKSFRILKRVRNLLKAYRTVKRKRKRKRRRRVRTVVVLPLNMLQNVEV